MFIYAMEIYFRLPDSFSLKDKRRTIRSILEHSRNRLKISAAELDYQNDVNQSVLGFVTVSHQKDLARNALHKLFTYIETRYDIQVIDYVIEER